MSTPKTVTGVLTHVERLNSSRFGNPRFNITLDEIDTYMSQTDANVGYDIMNYKVGSLVTLTLSRGGRVIGVEYA